MKKLDERSHWENEWADAFKEAEQAPSEHIWHNIDSVLANKEAKKYKKRAVFYKWLAAASIFISACGAVMFMLSNPQNPSSRELTTAVENATQPAGTNPSAGQEQNVITRPDEESGEETVQIASQEVEKPGSPGPERHSETVRSENKVIGTESATATGYAAAVKSQKKITGSKEEYFGEKNNSGSSVAGIQDEGYREASALPVTIAPVSAQENALNKKQGSKASSSGLAFLELERKGLPKNAIKPVDFHVTKVWMPSDFFKEKEEGAIPRFWLGASLATNSFNPNFQDNSPNPLAAGEISSNFKPQQASRLSTSKIDKWDESQESVLSLAGKIQGAAWLNEKWVLQAGIQYGTYKSSGNAGAYIDASDATAYPLHYSNFSMDKMNDVKELSDLPGGGQMDGAGQAVSAINTFEFVSVPLSVGYVVLDKKVGLMLTPGISSEFFLSNQLADEENLLKEYSISAGDGPYQTVHFRGLVGAQIFYKMGENYVISIEPAYQHAITDFNRSESYFDSRPSNISVGAGFRYIIR